ncbi:MAG TPA: hypothetical protein VGI39_17910 [Polyangiaceae bacterium]|jgi:hypothetical protein
MKLRALHAYTKAAIAATIGRVDESGKRSAPTFDGETLHIGRLKREDHVLHEIAHWLCAAPEHRALPNYGLGTDPDGGPETEYFLIDDIRNGRIPQEAGQAMRVLLETDREAFLDILKEKLSREEELASVVSIILMRLAGLNWRKEMARVFKPERTDEKHQARFWEFVGELARRGVDLADPIRPFRYAKRALRPADFRTFVCDRLAEYERGGLIAPAPSVTMEGNRMHVDLDVTIETVAPFKDRGVR